MNISNLRTPTPEEARKIGRLGGIASGEARRRRRTFREAFEIMLSEETTTEDGERMTNAEAIALAVFKRAMNGDTRAFEVIRDTIGEKPAQRIQAETIPTETREEVERIVNEYTRRAGENECN